ncbi:MAG: PEP-CTERM sorting domain-containing protein [Hydrogenophaga sp.]|uniref:PEP-CTERM sorting domain-containing protein n=1 Tax=Hydrogenophaga sp. TaxID=1904254 RepID=UPI002ABB2B2E|nr:PEP-CTERM sorting domain-containing protein [Hydrogenophaga sp.]MDZ4284138.1 PEP-CTERM sorting domain-containing protein [Hydrogenophaga sp.]
MKNPQNWSSKVFVTALLGLCGIVGNANAALVSLGTFAGNDCSGQGGFGNCYATQVGVQQGAPTNLLLLGSPSVYKLNSNQNAPTGSEAFGAFYPSVNGDEFSVSYDGINNVLSWTYTAGLNDPILHYVSIKQAQGYALFYDAGPITGGSIDLDLYFPGNPGWSHITFFNSNPTIQVPEPVSLALLGIGMLGLAAARRVKKA